MKSKEALEWAILELKEVSEPNKSADFLLMYVLRWDKAKFLANPEYNLTEEQERKFRGYIERRKKHEPLWYITGEIEFYGLNLKVNRDTLIPRPETELLIEEVKEGKKILDIGTGCGAIALSLSNKFRKRIYASDKSDKAIKLAKENARKLNLDVEFRVGNLLEPWRGEKFDVIVANLPYIPTHEMAKLSKDIEKWEPSLALDGGNDGLEIYDKLLSEIKEHLFDKYTLYFEIGIGQGEKIKKIANKYLPKSEIIIKKDYASIDRIAIISSL